MVDDPLPRVKIILLVISMENFIALAGTGCVSHSARLLLDLYTSVYGIYIIRLFRERRRYWRIL